METKICKKCNKERYHQYIKTSKSGNKLYIDEERRWWGNGNLCPICVSDKLKIYYKNKKNSINT